MAGITEKLIKLFNYIVVIIPLAMAAVFSFVYLRGGWEKIIEGHSPDFYSLETISNLFPCICITLLWTAVVLACVFLFQKIQKKMKSARNRKLCMSAAVFLLAFGIRFLLLYIYSEDLIPYSDFSAAWERARGNMDGGNLPYYSLFPAYLNFSWYENLVIRLFGEAYMNVLYLNAVYSGLAASLLYLTAEEFADNVFLCITAGVVYALYPSCVIYITSGTPEFLTILFNTLGLYLLLKSYRKNSLQMKCLMALAGGAALGIGGSFKTFSIVILIAFTLIVTADCAVKNTVTGMKKLLLTVIIVVLCITGYRLAAAGIRMGTSQYFDMEISEKTAVPHFLLIGLNTEAEGQIHVGTLSRLYNQTYLSNGMNYEDAKEYAYAVLKDDWRNNTGEIIPNFIKKMIWVWQDDCIPVLFFKSYVGIKPDTTVKASVYDFAVKYGAGTAELIYFLVIIFAILGAAGYVRFREINFGYEFIALILFGYFCMIFLAEGQSRYKCLVMGYMMILSASGTANIRAHCRKRIRRNEKRNV